MIPGDFENRTWWGSRSRLSNGAGVLILGGFAFATALVSLWMWEDVVRPWIHG